MYFSVGLISVGVLALEVGEVTQVDIAVGVIGVEYVTKAVRIGVTRPAHALLEGIGVQTVDVAIVVIIAGRRRVNDSVRNDFEHFTG